jgi:thioredoxin
MAAVNLNAQQLKQMMNEGKIVLVDYWAPWCGYCRRIAPAYDKIAAQYGDKLVIGKINIDEEPQLAHDERIEVIPTLVLYKGSEALGSMVAPESKAKIEEFISENLGI